MYFGFFYTRVSVRIGKLFVLTPSILDKDKGSVSDFYGDTPDYRMVQLFLFRERKHMYGHPDELMLIPCIPADTVG